MRMKIRPVMNVLFLSSGIFLLYNLLFYHHATSGKLGRTLKGVHEDPSSHNRYNYLKKKISSGRHYIREGIQTFAEKLYNERLQKELSGRPNPMIGYPENYEMSEKDFLAHFREVKSSSENDLLEPSTDDPDLDSVTQVAPVVREYLEDIRDSILAIRDIPFGGLDKILPGSHTDTDDTKREDAGLARAAQAAHEAMASVLGPIDTGNIQLSSGPNLDPDDVNLQSILKLLIPHYDFNETQAKNDISPIQARDLLAELETGAKKLSALPEVAPEDVHPGTGTGSVLETILVQPGQIREMMPLPPHLAGTWLQPAVPPAPVAAPAAPVATPAAAAAVPAPPPPPPSPIPIKIPLPPGPGYWPVPGGIPMQAAPPAAALVPAARTTPPPAAPEKVEVEMEVDELVPLKKTLRATLEDPDRIARCTNLTKSPAWKVAMTDRWHTVEERLMYVYSAYLDERVRDYVILRVFGLLEGWEMGMHLKPFCQIWYRESSRPFVVQAAYEWLPGQPIAKYKAVMMSCIYHQSQIQGTPVAVSMTTQPCSAPRFLIRVHNKKEVADIPKVNFTICLSGPMKFGYADVGQFVQWMEFNKKMGVNRFVLYNHSVDAALRPYLVYYAQKGDMQLFPWIVPPSIPNPLVYLKNLGHLAMLNDCLYRNMYTTKYIAYMDVDELIIPRAKHVSNWNEMVRDGNCEDKAQTIIKSVFFRREWPSDEQYSANETVTKLGLVALLKTKREKKIWPAFMRSKYFIKPTKLEACNVHNAFRFMNDKDGFSPNDTCVLEPKQALLQHYRYWGEVTGSYVVDTKAHEYADFFIHSVKDVYEDVLKKNFTLG